MGIDDVDRRFAKPKPKPIELAAPASGDLCAHPACGGRLKVTTRQVLIMGGVAWSSKAALVCGRCGKEPRHGR